MSLDLNELRIAIRGMLASKNPRAYPLWKVLQEELKDYWRPKPRGNAFTKGDDPRRVRLVPENKKPAN